MKLILLLTIGAASTLVGAAAAEPTSWVFLPSTYTHDPATGARVAQYQPVAAVEGLPDPREVISGYRRARTTLRGPNGTVDSTYHVTNFANGRGGLDAEWERVADEWRASFLTGGFFQQGPGFAPPGFVAPGFRGPGFGAPGFGTPGFGTPGAAFAPGFAPPLGFPGVGYPGYFPFPPVYHHPWHDLQRGQQPAATNGSGTR